MWGMPVTQNERACFDTLRSNGGGGPFGKESATGVRDGVTGMHSTNRSADIAMVSRTGDPATGEFGDATVIRKFGDVPGDLSAL